MQGVELLTTGRITLPTPGEDGEHLRAIRRGEVPLPDVLEAIAVAEQRLLQLSDSASVPAEPDHRWVDAWLHRSHLDYWATLA